MARLAGCRRRDVVQRLAARGGAVVAARAIGGKSSVIEADGQKADGRQVAALAGASRYHMCGVLTERCPAVVTTGTSVGDARVVHSGPRERRGTTVTCYTGCARRDVVDRFPGRDNPVVAGRATAWRAFEPATDMA